MNRLLDALPLDSRNRVLREAELVRLINRELLIEADQPCEYAYFVSSGAISLLTPLSDGTAVEFSTVGREGFVGVPAFLGLSEASFRGVVQIPGEAYRVPIGRLRELAREDGSLEMLLGLCSAALLTVACQSAACNGRHKISERCARWFLTMHDKVDSDVFPLTQEFLSQMLGVRRPSVSIAASILQRQGLIRYAYGHVTVLNRAALEDASCECYFAIRQRYEGIYDLVAAA